MNLWGLSMRKEIEIYPLPAAEIMVANDLTLFKAVKEDIYKFEIIKQMRATLLEEMGK